MVHFLGAQPSGKAFHDAGPFPIDRLKVERVFKGQGLRKMSNIQRMSMGLVGKEFHIIAQRDSPRMVSIDGLIIGAQSWVGMPPASHFPRRL